jgi:hypothetical protein
LERSTHAKDANDWLQASAHGSDDPIDLMCECGVVGCRAILRTTRGAYLSARNGSGHLLVAAEHHDEQEFQVLHTIGDVLVVVPRSAGEPVHD